MHSSLLSLLIAHFSSSLEVYSNHSVGVCWGSIVYNNSNILVIINMAQHYRFDAQLDLQILPSTLGSIHTKQLGENSVYCTTSPYERIVKSGWLPLFHFKCFISNVSFQMTCVYLGAVQRSCVNHEHVHVVGGVDHLALNLNWTNRHKHRENACHVESDEWWYISRRIDIYAILVSHSKKQYI